MTAGNGSAGVRCGPVCPVIVIHARHLAATDGLVVTKGYGVCSERVGCNKGGAGTPGLVLCFSNSSQPLIM